MREDAVDPLVDEPELADPSDAAETPGTIASDYPMPYSATWDYTNPQAYSFSMEVRFGDLLTGPETAGVVHPEDEELTVGTACGYDPDTDAVILGQLLVTATTERFDTDLSTAFTVNALGAASSGTSEDGRVQIAQAFSSGAECEYLSSENYGVADARVSWDEPVASGEVRTHEFYAVLTDYFGPATPDGDTEWFTTHGFVPNFGGSNTSAAAREEIYQADTSELVGITFAGDRIGRDGGVLGGDNAPAATTAAPPDVQHAEGAFDAFDPTTECFTQEGSQTVTGSVTGLVPSADYLVEVSWVSDSADVLASGFAVVQDLAEGSVEEVALTADVPAGATDCVYHVVRGDISG